MAREEERSRYSGKGNRVGQRVGHRVSYSLSSIHTCSVEASCDRYIRRRSRLPDSALASDSIVVGRVGRVGGEGTDGQSMSLQIMSEHDLTSRLSPPSSLQVYITYDEEAECGGVTHFLPRTDN